MVYSTEQQIGLLKQLLEVAAQVVKVEQPVTVEGEGADAMVHLGEHLVSVGLGDVKVTNGLYGERTVPGCHVFRWRYDAGGRWHPPEWYTETVGKCRSPWEAALIAVTDLVEAEIWGRFVALSEAEAANLT